MPFPIPNLDDRRFDDLVEESRARLQQHLPELTHLPPGDPAHAFIDLFAWLTETMLYRVNLIPERQRRAFLNLLQIPLRPAIPSRGLVCLDSGPRSTRLPGLVTDSSNLKAGDIGFSTVGELQPTPLQLQVMIKQRISDQELAALGIKKSDIIAQYANLERDIETFQPVPLFPGEAPMSLANTIDQSYYLAFTLPQTLVASKEKLAKQLAGRQINIGLAPANELPVDGMEDSDIGDFSRSLTWELIYRDDNGQYFFHPLTVKHDSSDGGRRIGVVRLVLPANSSLFSDLAEPDPLESGYDLSPPPLPDAIKPERTLFWLRLRSEDDPDLPLGYIGVNAAEVVGQTVVRDELIGVGNGEPGQRASLKGGAVEPASLDLQVEDGRQWVSWRQVDHFMASRPDDTVYRLDAASGTVEFGNGINGRRPPRTKRIRAAYYRYGGGSSGNLPADSIKELSDGDSRLVLRHDWPCSGGVDAESVTQAEQRIGVFLGHRERAVTAADFKSLVLDNPLNPVARAEVVPGFIPGSSIRAVRRDIPGALSVFVLPPADVADRQLAHPTRGLIKDVYNYLASRTLVGSEFYVLSPEFVPLAVSVRITVVDVQNEMTTYREAEDAVYRYLWPLAPGGSRGEGWPMGRPVSTAELITQVARVAGVLTVEELVIYAPGKAGWQPLEHDKLSLQDYQLPECLGVSASNRPPSLPGNLVGHSPDQGDGPRPVATPVIPESC